MSNKSLFVTAVISMMLATVVFASYGGVAGDSEVAGGYSGDYELSYKITGDTAEVTGISSGTPSEIKIPETVDIGGKVYTVTSIGASAFDSVVSLTKVTIPNSVTSIGRYAFFGCRSLTEISMPNNITIINDSTFRNCASLGKITIPDSVTSIRMNAFFGCSSLTEITIPENVKTISNFVFENCTSLAQINVKEGNENYCSQDGVLFDKDAKTLIQYPIGNNRVSYIIPGSVSSINAAAFENCTYLKEITLSKSITVISNSAFRNCTSLTEITIPENVTSILNFAFENCTSLTKIIIPDNVESIGFCTFRNCTSLTEITIPKSVTSIDYFAFRDCASLESISVDPDNAKYSSQDGVLFNKKKTTLLQYPIGNERTSYVIPDGVTAISVSAFYGCSSICSVTISNSVTNIYSNAFRDCTSLKEIDIPDSVTSIRASVFTGCTSLEILKIGKCNIDDGFSFEKGLKYISIAKGATGLGTLLKNYEFYDSEGKRLDLSEIDGHDYKLNSDGKMYDVKYRGPKELDMGLVAGIGIALAAIVCIGVCFCARMKN